LLKPRNLRQSCVVRLVKGSSGVHVASC
jgi:hypothetical protein